MSTSTTSGGAPAHGDLLLAAALVATLVMADLGLRLIDQRLSGNLAHVAEIPALIERVGTSGDARSTLLLGNSLTNNGVDALALAREAALAQVAKATPDGTSFWDWQCLLTHELLEKPERKVATLVMPTAWHLSSDDTRADASRLGALFCRTGDLAHAADIGIAGPGEIGEFLAARTLRLYALRDTLRNRALATAIPNYKRFAAEQNSTPGGAPANGVTPAVSYAHFSALAARLKAGGTNVVVVMMPVRNPYEIDAALGTLAARGDIRLLDYRHLPGLEEGSFIDEMHLGPQGRELLTAQLARDLGSDGR